MDKIILLDGNSLSYRAYYAMPALKNKKGLCLFLPWKRKERNSSKKY